MVNNKSEEGGSFLTDEEKDALLKEIKSIGDEIEETKINESPENHSQRTGV
jgi:hypothetical protein